MSEDTTTVIDDKEETLPATLGTFDAAALFGTTQIENEDGAMITVDLLPILVDEIEAMAGAQVFDMTTVEGRADCKSFAYKVKKSGAFIEKSGKGRTDELRKAIAPIMDLRNMSKARLSAVHDNVRQPLTDWEAAEAQRIQDLENEIKIMPELAQEYNSDNSPRTAEQMKENLSQLEAMSISDERFGKLAKDARQTLDQALYNCRVCVRRSEDREKLEIETERLRVIEAAAQAEKDAELEELRAKDAERESKAAEDAAKLQEANDAKNKAEQDKLAVERESLAKEQADLHRQEEIRKADEETARLENQAAEQAQADALAQKEAKAANVEHQKEINNEAANSFMQAVADDPGFPMLSIPPNQAQAIIALIALGKIKNVTINY